MLGNSPLFENYKVKENERVYTFGNVYSAYLSKNGKYLNLQIIKKLEDGKEEMITCPVRLDASEKNIFARTDGTSARVLIQNLYVPKTAGKPSEELHAEDEEAPF